MVNKFKKGDIIYFNKNYHFIGEIIGGNTSIRDIWYKIKILVDFGDNHFLADDEFRVYFIDSNAELIKKNQIETISLLYS